MKKEIEKIELDKNKVYIFNIEIGNMNEDLAGEYIGYIKDTFDKKLEMNNIIYLPMRNGMPLFTITELEKTDSTEKFDKNL